jgi:hypothetical protein
MGNNPGTFLPVTRFKNWSRYAKKFSETLCRVIYEENTVYSLDNDGTSNYRFRHLRSNRFSYSSIHTLQVAIVVGGIGDNS